MDPKCIIQYLNWYHEPEIAIVNEDVSDGEFRGRLEAESRSVSIGYGERRLIKTGRGANDPYMHTINSVTHADLGRYACVIANVRGERECSAYLTLRSSGSRHSVSVSVVATLVMAALAKIFSTF